MKAPVAFLASLLFLCLNTAVVPQPAHAKAFFASGMASGFCASGEQQFRSSFTPVIVSAACANQVGKTDFAAHSDYLGFGASGDIAYTDVPGHVSASTSIHAGYTDEVGFSGGPTLHLEWRIDGMATITGESGILDNHFFGFRTQSGDVFTGLRGLTRSGDIIFIDDHFDF